MNRKPVLPFLALVLIIGCTESHEEISAQKRLDMFYEKSFPEDSLIPFLAEGGEELVPLLVIEMQKKEAPKRRYIIATAGEMGDERALPALTSIVLDSTEEDYFRCDALESLSLIKPKYLDTIPDESKEVIKKIILECDKY